MRVAPAIAGITAATCSASAGYKDSIEGPAAAIINHYLSATVVPCLSQKRKTCTLADNAIKASVYYGTLKSARYALLFITYDASPSPITSAAVWQDRGAGNYDIFIDYTYIFPSDPHDVVFGDGTKIFYTGSYTGPCGRDKLHAVRFHLTVEFGKVYDGGITYDLINCGLY